MAWADGQSYGTYTSTHTYPPEAQVAYKTINLTRKEFSTFEEFYDLVAGRCNGATLHITADQAKTVYWALAGTEAWTEPNLLPADYRVSAIQKIVVVEE